MNDVNVRRATLSLLIGFVMSINVALQAQDNPQDSRHFVRVSTRDSRYFELTNGRPFIPIGLNSLIAILYWY